MFKNVSFDKRHSTIRACQKFFEKTLCISNGPVNKAFEKLESCGPFLAGDGRGEFPSANESKVEDILQAKHHIESFSALEPHYCRKTSSKRYLYSKLSILKMYNLCN